MKHLVAVLLLLASTTPALAANCRTEAVVALVKASELRGALAKYMPTDDQKGEVNDWIKSSASQTALARYAFLASEVNSRVMLEASLGNVIALLRAFMNLDGVTYPVRLVAHAEVSVEGVHGFLERLIAYADEDEAEMLFARMDEARTVGLAVNDIMVCFENELRPAFDK